MLSGFEKDFLSEDSTSDPNIGGMVAEEAKISDRSRSPSTILYALKKNLHAKVKSPSVFYLSTLMNSSQWAMSGRNEQGWSNSISIAPFLTPTLSSYNVGATLLTSLTVSHSCARCAR